MILSIPTFRRLSEHLPVSSREVDLGATFVLVIVVRSAQPTHAALAISEMILMLIFDFMSAKNP